MTQAPTVAVGDSVDHLQLDGLLLAAEERLGKLFGNNKSPFIFSEIQPDHQRGLPMGAVYMFSPFAGRIYTNGFPDQYNHAAALASINAATILGLHPDKLSLVIDGSDFGCLSIASRTWIDTSDPEQTQYTLPIRGSSPGPVDNVVSPQPDRFWAYAFMDAIRDGDGTPLAWNPAWDKYGCVRFHNLASNSWAVDLGNNQAISIPKFECRTIRRVSKNSPWMTGRIYFPPAVSLDVPSWQFLTNGNRAGEQMSFLADQSQEANPVCNPSLLAKIFRPTKLTPGGNVLCGMFHGPPTDGTAGSGSDKMIDLISHGGNFSILRSTIDGVTEKPHDITLATPHQLHLMPALGGIGLTTQLDPASHGLRIIYDNDANVRPPDPPGGSYIYDLLAHSTSVFGALCWPLADPNAGGLPPLYVRGPFTTNADIEKWFGDLFWWNKVPLIVTQAGGQREFRGVWVPNPDGIPPDGYVNIDPNVWGSWQTTSQDMIPHYIANWSQAAITTMPAWNLFTSPLTTGTGLVNAGPEALPLKRNNIQSKWGPLRATISLNEEVTFWHTVDANGPACPVSRYGDVTAVDYFGLDPIGLGQQTAGQEGAMWVEPRWQEGYLPVLGPRGLPNELALAHGPGEPWAYAQITFGLSANGLPDYNKAINPKVSLAEGGANGEPWAFDSTIAFAASPFGFARVWWLLEEPHQGDQWGYYLPQTLAGPPVMRARDHGNIIINKQAEGVPWMAYRGRVFDYVPVNPGDLEDVGTVQLVRMHASTWNALADLINRVHYIRPLGFEQWKLGFPFTQMLTLGGWTVAANVIPSDSNNSVIPDLGSVNLQPKGLVHFYTAGGSAVDDWFFTHGVPLRTSTEPPEITALKTIPLVYIEPKFFFEFQGPVTQREGIMIHPIPETDRPQSWRGQSTFKYVHWDDFKVAMDASGFPWAYFNFTVSAGVATYVPSQSDEVKLWERITTIGNPDFVSQPEPSAGILYRWRIASTTVQAVLDPNGPYQVEGSVSGHSPLFLADSKSDPPAQGFFQQTDYQEIIDPPLGGEVLVKTVYQLWKVNIPKAISNAVTWYGTIGSWMDRKSWQSAADTGGQYMHYGCPFLRVTTNQASVRVLAIPHATPYSQADEMAGIPAIEGEIPFNNVVTTPLATDRPKWMTMQHDDLITVASMQSEVMVDWQFIWVPEMDPQPVIPLSNPS